MLDAYIIDKIKQEELERERQFEEGRRIWLELPKPWQEERREDDPDAEDQRGPIIIPLYPNDVEDAA